MTEEDVKPTTQKKKSKVTMAFFFFFFKCAFLLETSLRESNRALYMFPISYDESAEN